MKEWKFRGKRQIVSVIIVWIMAVILSACGQAQKEGQTTGTFSPVVFAEGMESSVSGTDEETNDTTLPKESSLEEAQLEETLSQEESGEATQKGIQPQEGTQSQGESKEESWETSQSKTVQEDGIYTDKEQVACYLHLYGHIPDNYITKKEAENLGWDSGKGNLDDVAPGKSIGGGRFGNREGLLPDKKGRTYYECDIDYEGGYRGAKRIVYSNDGLIYYTEDHYNSFELLYTSEGKAE